jgi:chaperonin cofactor prefoldin
MEMRERIRVLKNKQEKIQVKIQELERKIQDIGKTQDGNYTIF